MKKIYLLCFAICINMATFGQKIPFKGKMEQRKGELIICPADQTDANTFVPAPAALQNSKARLAAGLAPKSTFVVTYNGFPEDARASFQAAVDIWQSLLSSSVPIRVQANYVALDRGVLGSATPTDFYRNFDGAQKAYTWHPVALAEKIARKNVNSNSPDIVANFNSEANWFFAGNGTIGNGQYDFTSVVLHELGHGLGFYSSFSVSADKGNWGQGSSSPFIFDHFVENDIAQSLLNTTLFKNPSTQLRSQLTSNKLYFNSPIATAENGVRPRLYAPSTYNAGSSISHLNDITYPNGNINSLMTPTASQREVVRNPGPIVLNMFADMGWRGTSVLHQEMFDTEDKVNPITFTARIESDTTLVQDKLLLNYTINDTSSNFKQLKLIRTGTSTNYTASIPPTAEDKIIRYYISAQDATGTKYTNPPQAPKYVWSFKVGTDKELPTIAHDPIGVIYEKDTVAFFAEVYDNLGVDSVYVEYSLNGVSKPKINLRRLVAFGDGVFGALLPQADVKAGNNFKYRIVAVDKAKNRNKAFEPATGFLEFSVVKIKNPQARYSNNFNDLSSTDFAGDFSIKQQTGFANGAIHSAHPYKNGSNANKESNYVYQLLVPITLKADSAKLRFDEIVLVEPGESGAAFGSDFFFDYVVAEGSKDGGYTWYPFQNGYDSNADKAWLTAYNSSLVADPKNSQAENSIANGDPTLFKKREIDMLASGRFSPKDNVLVRFRLFADELANGWGWCIDNLEIQIPPPVSAILANETLIEDLSLNIFPNPSPDEIQIKASLKRAGKVLMDIVDVSGRKMMSKEITTEDRIFYQRVDIKNLQSGIYFAKIYTSDGIQVKKFVVQK